MPACVRNFFEECLLEGAEGGGFREVFPPFIELLLLKHVVKFAEMFVVLATAYNKIRLSYSQNKRSSQ